jgi:hypothetical protein
VPRTIPTTGTDRLATSPFAATFATLRAILQRHVPPLLVVVDKPGDYQVASPTLVDRIGRPLFMAAVQIKKSYVSYHFIPVYAKPELLESVSPALRRRMQGRSCFNFAAIDATQSKELAALTRTGIAAMRAIELPWTGATDARATRRASRRRSRSGRNP